MSDNAIFLGKSDKREELFLPLANRHGLVTGATGTGKTVTLQIMAESFCKAGVPVFAADVKGDLSGISQVGTPLDALTSAPRKLVLTIMAWKPRRRFSGTYSANRATPSAPPYRKWAPSCCRVSWASRKRRKAP